MENISEEPLLRSRINEDFQQREIKVGTGEFFHDANPLSKLTFSWSRRAMRVANQESLKIHHLGSVWDKHKSTFLMEKLKAQWEGKAYYKSRRCCPLLRAVIKANASRITVLMILSFIVAFFNLAVIYLLRQIILTFQIKYDPTVTEEPIMPMNYLVGSLLAAKLLNIFLTRQSYFVQSLIGVESSIGLSTLIYDKLAHISSYSISKSSEGEITNYIQIDAEKMASCLTLAPSTIVVPFQFGVYIYMLFQYFGFTFVFGTGTLLIILFFIVLLQRKYMHFEEDYMASKDERMKITSQTFAMLKILKLYGWEDEFINRIQSKRKIELKIMKKIQILDIFASALYWTTPIFVSITAIGFYQYFNEHMNIANILTSIGIFNAMTEPLYTLPMFTASLMDTIVAMRRVQKFLHEPNINEKVVKNEPLSAFDVQIKQCDFGYEVPLEEEENSLSKCKILEDVSLNVKKGELVAVIGEIGSGKTSLLNAIMNNMLILNDGQLVVNGSIAYVAQNSWIMNETVRNNILFFKDYDADKYNDVLQRCQLREDLDCLTGGDMTEIGEKGVNLSGGQKVRVAIARAVYTEADIYLLDDPLSALDAYVGKRIFEEVVVNLLHEKTRIVVTHALQYLDKVDKIIYMDNGKIYWTGTYHEIQDQPFFSEFREKIIRKTSEDESTQDKKNKAANTTKVTEEKTENSQVARITKDEEQEVGRVKTAIYFKFISLIGGTFIFILTLLCSLIWQGLTIFSDYWLTLWTVTKNLTKEDNFFYFGIYSSFLMVVALMVVIRTIMITFGVIRLNRILHDQMIHRLIRAPINLFHDTIPKGQIMNRLSKDLDNCTYIGWYYSFLFRVTISFIGAFVMCAIFNVWSIMFLPFLLILGVIVTRYYMNAGRDLNRLEGISRSPIISVYSETIPGLVTIRAFKYTEHFKNKFHNKLNDFYKVKIFESGANNWFGLNLDFSSFILLVFILVFAVVFQDSFSPQAVGLMLTYSINLTDSLYWIMNEIAEIERQFVSLERCDSYTKIVQEAAYELPSDERLVNWPTQGEIQFDDLSVKYRPDTDIILKNMSLMIKPCEKIGVVGRTGSGKSTLCLCLFRILEPLSGRILIDGVDLQAVGLKTLRRSLSIIPQDPALIEGTLRENVDPLGEYDDKIISGVLKEIGLDYLELDMSIKENGSNLSIGEKQLVCIARAILRRSKIIVMDEATSSIDMKTEILIQNAINSALKHSTVMTIAHRIKTILHYDRIVVLSKGSIVECDSPSRLIDNRDSLFYELYSKSSL